MGNKKFSPSQSALRKVEMLTTGGLFVALLITGKTVAKAASVAVAPPTGEPGVTSKADASVQLTQKFKKMTEFAQKTKLTCLTFGSEECAPCKELEGVITNNAKEKFGDQVEFVHVDIDDPATEALQDKYQVGAIPAVFYLDKDGFVVHQTVGYGGKDWFLAELNSFTNRVIAHNTTN